MLDFLSVCCIHSVIPAFEIPLTWPAGHASDVFVCSPHRTRAKVPFQAGGSRSRFEGSCHIACLATGVVLGAFEFIVDVFGGGALEPSSYLSLSEHVMRNAMPYARENKPSERRET